MRRCYLVCYDIADDKRLRKVHRIMCGYGEPWQYSVFHCFLKEIDLVRMRTQLEDIMNLKEDQVLVLDLKNTDPNERPALSSLGRSVPPTPTGMLIV